MTEHKSIDVSKYEAFLTKLNQQPDEKELAVNKYANNSKYLPISFVETQLDELFLGLWQTEDFKYSIVANEVVGVITLKVFHPIAQTWISKIGAAAVPIQQRSKENGGSGDITNISDKIVNTLVKDFPHLEAMCIVSAAKKLGKTFGRDLNRKLEDTYQPIYTIQATIDEVKMLMEQCVDLDQLKALYDDYPDMQNIKDFKAAFSAKRQKLQLLLPQ